MSGPVTSVARVEDVQIFLKDPVCILQPGGGDSSHEKMQYIYGKKMCTGRAKPIRIIDVPDSQRPDKRSSTVNAFVSFISITMYVSTTHSKPLSKRIFSLTDTAITTVNQLAKITPATLTLIVLMWGIG